MSEIQIAAHPNAVFRLQIELVQQRRNQMIWNITVNVDRDGLTACSSFQRSFEVSNKVFGLFSQFQITVAEKLEETGVVDLKTGEKTVKVTVQHFGDRNDARLAIGCPWQADESGHVGRDHQQACKPAGVTATGQLHHHRNGEVADEREGVARVDRNWRKNRQPFGFKRLFEVEFFTVGQLVPVNHVDIGSCQFVPQVTPDLQLLLLQVAHAFGCHFDLLRGSQPFG